MQTVSLTPAERASRLPGSLPALPPLPPVLTVDPIHFRQLLTQPVLFGLPPGLGDDWVFPAPE